MAFKFSVVMAAYNSEQYISSAIRSIINQSLDFRRNIQIIIIDDGSSDSTYEIADYYRRKYPKNIFVLRNDDNYGPAYSRNRGLGHVQGKFVNFLDSDDFITEYAFGKVFDLFKKHDEIDIVSIPIHFFGSMRGEHSLNYKFNKTKVVDLLEEPESIQLSGASSFFRSSKIRDYKFQESLRVSEDPLLINQMLLDNPKIGYVDDCIYYYRKHDEATSLIGASTNFKSYFTTRVDDYFFRLLEDALERYDVVPKFIQHVVMYDLQWIFEIRKLDYMLDEKEFIELYAKLMKLLSYIDEDVIIFQKSISGLLKTHILLLKKYNIEYLSDKYCEMDMNCNYFDELELNNVHIDICQVKNDELYVLGYYTTFVEGCDIKVLLNDSTEINVNTIEFPQRDNYSLNFNYGFNYHFDVSIPLEDNLHIVFKANRRKLIPDYNRTSRLSKTSGYLLSCEYVVLDNDDSILIKKKEKWDVFKREVGLLKTMLLNREEGWRTGVLLRLLYFLTYPMFNDKRLWIFMDLPYLADDNAFELFKYVVEANNPEIEKYFAIEKGEYYVNDVEIMANRYNSSSMLFKLRSLLGIGNSSREFQKVKDIGFQIPYKSIRHRLYSLFAEAIISSQADNHIIYPFWGNFHHVSGLMRSKTIFLQHGVITEDISSWLNKCDKNLDFILTSGDGEKESILNGDYGYDEESIHVLGLPRFDNHHCLEDKKEVVIMPTWRRQYDNLLDEYFTRTTFFKRFNALLCDKELIDFLGSEGYTLVFKPHPNLHKFIHLFDIGEDVEFDDEDYGDIFNHSSLLVTDYSSVAFDFAYLEKPVIYYHYEKDYHFDIDTSYFDYDSMGFGPVAKTYEELKNEIIANVLSGCEMDEIYKGRVGEFFRFRDDENSKRVYEEIMDMDFKY